MKEVPIKGITQHLGRVTTIVKDEELLTDGMHSVSYSVDTVDKMMRFKAGLLEKSPSNRFLEREVMVLFEHLEAVNQYTGEQKALFRKFVAFHNKEVGLLMDVVRQLEARIDLLQSMVDDYSDNIFTLTHIIEKYASKHTGQDQQVASEG